MKKIYFPNLNGVRFIAAFLVIIHHVEQLKGLYRLPNQFRNPLISGLGELGVTLFFVLSGFLITYMLFAEREHVGTIDIKGFYIRRMLRIWPLYFLIVILAFFVLVEIPQLQMPVYSQYVSHEFKTKFLLFVVFLPNAALLLYPPVAFASQAWSIGVEEQFYLVWPVLMRLFKKALVLLVVVIIFYWILKLTIFYIMNSGASAEILTWAKFAENFIALTRINCMAIGGIGAYILFERKQRILALLYSRYTQYAAYLAALLLIVYGINIPYVNDETYSLLFMIIILNLAANKKTIIALNNKPFDYLGKISYGLYMYHPLGIVMSMAILLRISSGQSFEWQHNAFIYVSSIAITILISAISYGVFEKLFIKRKILYSKIVSGENAKGV